MRTNRLVFHWPQEHLAMRKGPNQVISKLLSLFAEEAVGKLLPHP
jgi:hypothetical protein